MDKRSTVQSSPKGSPRLSGSVATGTVHNNRKVVVVGQKMVKAFEMSESHDAESRNEVNVSFSGTSLQDSLSDCSAEKPPVDDLSSPDGSTGSHSSIIGSVVDVTITSTDNKLINELKNDIKTTASQLMKLQSEVEEIPKLKEKIDALQKEKKLMSEDLSEKCEIIQTMKQRLSVLHEQNSQLAQLTKSESSGSSETLRIRNALVASISQLKKLQEQVDELPGLKSELLSLNRENARLIDQEQNLLQQFSINLPQGSTVLDYNSLLEENVRLKQANDILSTDMSHVVKGAEILSGSIEDLKQRVEGFEKSMSNSYPLISHVKKLEKDIEELFQENIELKLNKSISHDFDTVNLENECATLRKNNKLMQIQLENVALTYRQQKEKIISKLFEIEVSSVQAQKCEVEKRLSSIEGVSYKGPVTHESIPPYTDDESLTPHFKAQILKLHQIKLQNEQSLNTLQVMLSEKSVLETRIAEYMRKLEEKSVNDMESKLKEYENKIDIARAKICDLEKRLHRTSKTANTDDSTLRSENLALKAQVSSLKETSGKLAELQKQLIKEKQSHEIDLQKYKKAKDKKHGLEKKLKESRDRFQTIASELSNSVQLLKKYKIQLEELENVAEERKLFRDEVSALKAELVVMKAERGSDVLSEDTKQETNSGDQSISMKNTDSRIAEYSVEITKLSQDVKKLEEERDEALREVNSKSTDLKLLNERLIVITDQFKKDSDIQQEKYLNATDELISKVKMLENEKDESMKLLESSTKSKELLEKKITELEEEKISLNEMVSRCDELQAKLNTMEELNNHNLSNLSNSKLRLSNSLATIDCLEREKRELITIISTKEMDVDAIKSDLKSKELELEECKQALNAVVLKEDYRKSDHLTQATEFAQMKSRFDQLTNEVEGYKAIISSLQRQVDEAETREIEHEHLKHKIKAFEKSLEDSSHDNRALIKVLHDTLKEIPSFSMQAEHSLQNHNLQLEEQVSVLSQWNDNQRQEIEQLEKLLEEASTERQLYSHYAQENSQLKRELKEIEVEINVLRRQTRSDMQEELKLRVETQTNLIAVFNQHNSMLQKQVEELQSQVKQLGGQLDRDKAVSPPPMPDLTSTLSSTSHEDNGVRSLSDLEKENVILKEKIRTLDEGIKKLHLISPAVRRCSSTLNVLSSVPIGAIKEDMLISAPNEMFPLCSLLSDHLNSNLSLDDANAQSWLDAIHKEWFACMSQKVLTPACAQSYIATISNFSQKLLDIVINLQDKKGNTALHYTAANGNFPTLYQFIKLPTCDPCITNKAGYNPLLLISACTVGIGNHERILDIMVEKIGINSVAKKDHQTALMIAASSGNSDFVRFFLKKGCNVNAKDKDGSTALMFATQCGHEDIIQILLNCSNCDIHAKDNEGQTARDIARTCGYPGILKRTKH